MSTLQNVGNSSYLVYFPSLGREKRVFRLRAYLAKKNYFLGVLLDVSSLRRTESSRGRLVLRLGEGKVHLGKRVGLGEGMFA